jgi:hypothetical protein
LFSVITCETVAGTIRRSPWGRITSGLALPAVERLDARAHDLGDDGRVVEDERQQRGEDPPALERLGEEAGSVVLVGLAPRRRHREREVEDEEDQRQVAEDVDPHACREAHRAYGRQPQERERQPDDEAEEDRDQRDLEVDREALEDEPEVAAGGQPLPVVGVEEVAHQRWIA